MTAAVTVAQSGAPGVSLGFKNRIINGGMTIDQRNAGASVTPANGANTYTLDRWGFYVTQASKLTVQQNSGSVTPPAGFTKYLGVVSSSAYSVGSSDEFNMTQVIEGLNAADLAWGTNDAKTVTLSFWVRSSLTGTFGGAIRNGSVNRSYPYAYTINSANTWEQKSITIPGDTTGTWATDNGAFAYVGFAMGAGSSTTATAGTWTGSNKIAPTGSTSVVGTSGATFYITGVQLEVGTAATQFEFRDYGRELIMCQRYFVRFGGNNTYEAIGAWGSADSTSSARIYVPLPVSMRAVPSVAVSGMQLQDGFTPASAISGVSIITDGLSPLNGYGSFQSSGLTQGRPYALRTAGSYSAYVAYSAEL